MTSDPPCRHTDFEVEIREDQAQLTNLSSGVTHILNASAFAIWELCDGETDVTSMAEALAEITPMDHAEAEDQVRLTIRLLKEKGLVS
jgi:hypothetical protein